MYLPLQQQEDTPDFSGQPETGLLQGIRETVAHDLQFGTTAQITEGISDAITPGKILTSQEYEKGPWKRPGLSFPKGVSEARAKRSAMRHDANVKYQDEMSGMNNGLLSSVGRFAGNAIGFTVDPLNALAVGGAVASGGAISEPLVAAAAEYSTVAALGTKFAVGGLEGALATAPAAAVDYGAGTFYGEDPSMLHAVGSLAINAALGGLLHTAFGAKGIIDKDSHYEGMKTAVDQLEAGKSVHVDESVQNGAYQNGIIQDSQTANVSSDDLNEQQQVRRQSMLTDLEKKKARLDPMDGLDDLKQKVDDQIGVLKGDKPITTISDDVVEPASDIKGTPLTRTDILNENYSIDSLKGRHSDDILFAKRLGLQLNDNYAEMLSDSIKAPPVDSVQLTAAAKKIMGYEGDSTTNIQELNDIKADTAEGPDVETLKNNAEGIKDTLPDDLKSALENIDDVQKTHNNIADEVQKYVDCIKGAGITL